ncbi:MAG: hypothetical protein ACK2UM_07225 [Anaerolineales bacterium]
MSGDELSFTKEAEKTSLYRIVVRGELQESWSDWLGKVEIERIAPEMNSSRTILLSEVPDQAGLRGLLNRIWDLNLELISLNKLHQDN